MSTPILTLAVWNKRDIVRVRQRARQLARLVGYSCWEQAYIAAAAFEIASDTCQASKPATLQFEIADQTLRVFVLCPQSNSRSFRLEKPLPSNGPRLPPEDLAWAMQELARISPLCLFDEIRLHNQELLRACKELKTPQGQDADKVFLSEPARAA